jgi:hypothetical protein
VPVKLLLLWISREKATQNSFFKTYAPVHLHCKRPRFSVYIKGSKSVCQASTSYIQTPPDTHWVTSPSSEFSCEFTAAPPPRSIYSGHSIHQVQQQRKIVAPRKVALSHRPGTTRRVHVLDEMKSMGGRTDGVCASKRNAHFRHPLPCCDQGK